MTAMRSSKGRRTGQNRLRQQKDKNAYLPGFRIAIDYARLQNKDKTLEYLNKVYGQREPQIVECNTRPIFRFLRDDPRFKELLRKMGLPD